MYNDIWEEYYCTRCESKHLSNVGNPLHQKEDGAELCKDCNEEYNRIKLQEIDAEIAEEFWNEPAHDDFLESDSFIWALQFFIVIATMSILLYLLK